MGFVGDVLTKMMRQWLVDNAFNKGLNGEPPPQAISPNVQVILDEAYEKGRQALLNKVGRNFHD